MKALISINACSNEVSFKSDAVASVFENVPATVGCAVLNKVTPSPEVNDPPVQACLGNWACCAIFL